MNKKLVFMVLLSAVASFMVWADNSLNAPALDGVRSGGTLANDTPAPNIPATVTPLKKPMRNYPDQPPTIPHSVERYQLTKNFNQCLTCHSRARSPDSGAPMVSITHYLDRDHQILAAVSPRRYFCLQCHVPQHAVEQATGSNFKGIEAVLAESQKNNAGKSKHNNSQVQETE
ncbi:nitrate reductase cytochrome c-type subunit [Pseudomaricurvus sp.]|uniref:nitrate reductase cytochrome c-type subunit n=1 Tax=Pseudomaricurvus sp. TaxID=2004510 RepID=UPI003F6B61C4